jgi:hypothetical protein
MTRVVIKASDVAAIIGRNPYKPQAEVRSEIWKKYWPESFTGQTKNDRARVALSASQNAIQIFEEAACVKTKSSNEAEDVFQMARAKIEVDEQLTNEQKCDVIEHIRSRIYTSHGTRSEDKTSDKMESEENVILKKDNSFYRISICEIGEFDFEIVGKIDRIQEMPDGSRVLVEIKNRTKRLFRKVPDYEYIQVQTYLQMLNLEHARLVEQFNSQIMSHDIDRDDEFWKEVMTCLESFCKEIYCAAG